jgi:hypothetical protein
MSLDERIQEFCAYFDEIHELNMQGFPIPVDHSLLIEKAQQLNLPIPQFNEYDQLVVNWEGYE